jgi:proliferating cell nuclear antigen
MSSKSISELQFFTITKNSDIWNSVSSAIMTIIDEALFDAGPEGITFRSMDPSHIALIDINWSSSAFEQYHCSSTMKFGVRIDEFSKIIKRANANDSIEIGIQDNSSLNVKTSGSGYLRNYKMRLIESTGNVSSPLPQMTFNSKIIIGIAALDKILNDVGVISEKITIDTSSNSISNNKTTAIFSGNSDRGEARIIMQSDNDDKNKVESLQEITAKENSKSTYNIDFISKIIRAIGNQSSSNLVTIEYSSNKPLRLEFLLLSGMVRIQFYLAPRVQD